MSKTPSSFVMLLRRRYRVYFNPQGGAWYAAYEDGDQRKRVSLWVSTKPEAEAAVRALDCPPETPKAAEPVKAGPVLWKTVVTGFLQHKQLTGRTERTVDRCTASLAAFERYLNTLKITEAEQLTIGVLEGYATYRIKTEKCDPITAYTDQIVIKGALKWAARPSRKMVMVNPALDWETPRPPKPKKRTYTPEEVTVLETGVRAWLRPVITTLAWTGMRIDELKNLRWKDVDLKERVLHIRVQEEWRPKGKRDRTVPLHPKVEDVLKMPKVGEHVFYGRRGGRIKESFCLQSLKRDMRKLGVVENDLHGFRRFFATTMMRAGVSAETVRQWGGWKSLQTMLRYLADVNVKDSVAAMDQAVKHLVAG